MQRRKLLIGLLASSVVCRASYEKGLFEHVFTRQVGPKKEEIQNYSQTHSCEAVVHRPRNEEELMALLSKSGKRYRAVGSALSPNGIGLPEEGVEAISLSNMDRVVSLNLEEQTVTIQAGCTVRAIQEYLSEHNLTLENFSSILDQEIAGWTQVSAHGTGATLPPVEEQISRLRIATPGMGVLTLSDRETDPVRKKLFSLAKVNLGTLGITTELTLRCAKLNNLRETVSVVSNNIAFKTINTDLVAHKHLKYMFVPGEDFAVKVVCDETTDPHHDGTLEAEQRNTQPLRELLKEKTATEPSPDGTFASYRDQLIKGVTQNKDFVQKINKAEVSYWRNRSGTRVADSSDILAFECGGHQWVYEVCIPSGTLSHPSTSGTDYVRELLALLKANPSIPAPSPIETRFTSASSALLSPAYSSDSTSLFTWVGIIMYIPDGERDAVTASFERYKQLTNPLQQKYKATPHWAKIEFSDSFAASRIKSAAAEPLRELSEARRTYDPNSVLSHSFIDKLCEA
eukprot:TRINITY_DN3564_c0_g1_i1.p1 TRINITY_DN3564_c0_g1~~TRINITY_DN3564_c0_g1_i1.p1  ORF type:complete len:514 (+),score=101.61 TRINITY_DN3564_c0_g1_i1:48-1589(+)